uniref:DUF1618 domain-containing protein n=1 Tax=Setaria italica TaxID=4555 RepID=K3YYX2_SETIT
MSAAAAAGGFPNWVLLEPYVFRRDDDESFPDETHAPIRASGTTSWGADFRIAFSLAEPPLISRLYAQLPGVPGPRKARPLAMLKTHRHLALLVVISPTSDQPFDYSRRDHRLPRRRSSSATPRLLNMHSLGLWCGDKEEFVVAQLNLCVPTIGRSRIKAFADICLLRSSDQLGGNWESMRVPILNPSADDLWKLSQWQNTAIIPFQRWLCWIDYKRGILFCDVSGKVLAPTVSFLWFPEDKPSLTRTRKITMCGTIAGMSVVDHGPLKPGTGFTITCHTLVLAGGSMAWKEDYTVTSGDLPDCYQRGIPMHPQVDIDRPHVVHFLFIEFFGLAYEKMSVLSIDMSTKTMVSCYLYMNGNEILRRGDKCCQPDVDIDFVISKCLAPSPLPFPACEFPRFCNLSRYVLLLLHALL